MFYTYLIGYLNYIKSINSYMQSTYKLSKLCINLENELVCDAHQTVRNNSNQKGVLVLYNRNV